MAPSSQSHSTSRQADGHAQNARPPGMLSTGSLRLDLATGVGGLPCGHMFEFFGPPGSGKTMLCLHAIAEAQKLGASCAYIDADHALDPQFAAVCGVFIDNLLYSTPNSSEQALETAEILVSSGAVQMVVIDSLSALSPQAELNGVLGKSYLRQHDRLLTRSLHRLAKDLQRSPAVMLLTSQWRPRSGAIKIPSDSGLSVKLHSAIRLELKPGQKINEDSQRSGEKLFVRVVKNKFSPTFHTIELDIMYNEGICKVSEIFDLGSGYNLISCKETGYHYGSLWLGQDRHQATHYLRENPQIAEELEIAIRRTCFPLAPGSV